MKRIILGLFIFFVIAGYMTVQVLPDHAHATGTSQLKTPNGSDGEVIFAVNDPRGDEHGPGSYTYPLHEHFQPYRGLFDLTRFTIREKDPNYVFEFSFAKITNPWRSKHGFSHPLMELYIDNEAGGSKNLFQPGARVQLDPSAPWDMMLHITGWWVRGYHPEDREKLQDTDLFWNTTTNPFDLPGSTLKLVNQLIRVSVPKKLIGSLKGAKFFVLIGSFDPFGYDNFRNIGKRSERWDFGGNKWGELGPRVLDLVVPTGMTQSQILTLKSGARQPVILPYLSCPGQFERFIAEEKVQIFGLTLLVVLMMAIIIIVKSKKNPLPG